MELKVVCNCGQKYKFEVEPAEGRMPFAVNCPVCGVDGTNLANALLVQSFPRPAPATVTAPRIATPPPPRPPVAAAPAMAPAMAAPGMIAAAPILPPLPGVLKRPKSPGEFNMGLGILGAILGAALGAGLMYGFFMWAQFKFPLMGSGIGALSGLGARILFKGTSSTLGAITAVISLAATAAALYFMYGDIAGIFLLTLCASAYMGYRIAA